MNRNKPVTRTDGVEYCKIKAILAENKGDKNAAVEYCAEVGRLSLRKASQCEIFAKVFLSNF